MVEKEIAIAPLGLSEVERDDGLCRLCIVLRPADRRDDPQRYVLHWPQIAMQRADLNERWCTALLQDDAHWPQVVKLSPRNTQSFYPMYGCTDDPTQPAMLAWAVHGLSGRLQTSVGEALQTCPGCLYVDIQPPPDPPAGRGVAGERRHGTDALRALDRAHDGVRAPAAVHPWGKVGGMMIPTRPQPTSINPMGSPPLHTPSANAHGQNTLEMQLLTCDPTDQQHQRGRDEGHRAQRVLHMLRCLQGDRRSTPARQNSIGAIVYNMTRGSWLGFSVWLSWIHEWRQSPPTLCKAHLSDFLEQWRQFATDSIATSGYCGEARLRTMVEEDCTPKQLEDFYRRELEEDNQKRQHEDPTVACMGSLTHFDLARYVKQFLQNRVVCSSTAGRGMWYRYSEDDHRWYFDKDGPGVVLMCHRILLRYLEELRSQVNAAIVEKGEKQQQEQAADVTNTPPRNGPSASANKKARGGGGSVSASQAGGGAVPVETNTDDKAKRGGGGRKPDGEQQRAPPMQFMVNFPAYSRRDDGLALQRALVVHLDSAIGDMRHIQSILRALALFLHREDFASRLDVENEHLRWGWWVTTNDTLRPQTPIPFSNGVLDMAHGCLRPGLPSDMVMRGPDYPWCDYEASDANVLEVETMLTTMFPDQSIRDFMLDVGASLLQKRNRFKHFYILTGAPRWL